MRTPAHLWGREAKKISNKRIGKRFVPPQKAIMSLVVAFSSSSTIFLYLHWLFLHRRFVALKLAITVRFFPIYMCTYIVHACIVLIRLFAPHIFTLCNNNILTVIKFRSACIYAVHFGSVSFFFFSSYFILGLFFVCWFFFNLIFVFVFVFVFSLFLFSGVNFAMRNRTKKKSNS